MLRFDMVLARLQVPGEIEREVRMLAMSSIM